MYIYTYIYVWYSRKTFTLLTYFTLEWIKSSNPEIVNLIYVMRERA